MTYLSALSALAGLLFAWWLFGTLRRRRRRLDKQEQLSSSFARSQAMRLHGPGAQGITQNILIAHRGPYSPTLRRGTI